MYKKILPFLEFLQAIVHDCLKQRIPCASLASGINLNLFDVRLHSVVTPDMVTKFVISPICAQSIPCQHQCEITLNDGRKTIVDYLAGSSIDCLIKEIAKENIINYMKDNPSHFDFTRFKGFYRPAKDILTEIFRSLY